jgi:hypothetical protein
MSGFAGMISANGFSQVFPYFLFFFLPACPAFH